MRKTILIFGSLAAVIFILYELNKWSLWGLEEASNVFLVLSGLLFIGVGIVISRFLWGTNMNNPSPLPSSSILTKQEQKVLQLMHDGLSNFEIAEKLYIAESTVKTHVSHILSKLQAKRRTEAIKKGRDLQII